MTWIERSNRSGWTVAYTTIGGRPNTQDPLDLLSGDEHVQAVRRISQAMVATSWESPLTEDPDLSYWATVVCKIAQRGLRPPVPRGADAAVHPSEHVELTAQDVRASLLFQPVDIDRSVELHPTFERPFWDRLIATVPHASGWCVPQAPLERIAGAAKDSERWVDFLITVPWSTKPLVVELDGAGHARQTGVDAERDRLISSANVTVERIKGGDDPHLQTFFERLRNRTVDFVPEPHQRNRDVDRIVHGPSQLNRFLYAIAVAVADGVLPPGPTWSIAVQDPTGAVPAALETIFSVLDAVADVWGLDVTPPRVAVNDTLLVRTETGWVRQTGHTSMPQLTVRLDPLHAAHQSLAEADGPTMVIRSALLPVDLGWAAPSSFVRRNTAPSGKMREALSALLQNLFGYDSFREGQADAITRVLSGGDACVLLPTGSGKTLIYHMAGLLRPGLTIVVAPLKALIDDQERRLVELGIDRTIGLHSGKGASTESKSMLHRAIAEGDALFCLVAPERLQIDEFRRSVGEAASETLVGLAVVDEAHCVSEWGHQFRTSYLRLGRNLRNLCSDLDDVPPPILALTGTASPAVLRDVLIELGMDPDEPGVLHRPASFDRPNLHFRFHHTNGKTRMSELERAIEATATALGVESRRLPELHGTDTLSGIVFVPHTNSGRDLGIEAVTRTLQRSLNLDGRSVARYAGEQWKPRRGYKGFGTPDLRDWGANDWEAFKAKNATAFRTNDVPIMVSTSAFGMGIDKPNIRWTIHLTHPNSLEALGQEAGRAGRDLRDAYCTVISCVDGSRDSDLAVQTYFHDRSFPAVEDERETALRVAQEIIPTARPAARIVVPRITPTSDPNKSREDVAVERERALYRLMLIGLVDDYTIEYKAQTFTVDLADYTYESMQKTVRTFVDRATAGQRLHETAFPDAEAPLGDLIAGYIGIVLRVLHDTVVPGRKRALEEMHRVADEAPSDSEMHEILDAYLGAGMVSLLLDKVSRAPELDVSEAVRDLSTIQPATRQEWAASSSRFLESYPDHPIMLAVRSLGEAWLTTGDQTYFRDTVQHLARSIQSYTDDSADGVALVDWTTSSLRKYFEGARWSWTADVWASWEHTGWDDEALRPLEDRVIERAAGGSLNTDELDAVLARRLARTANRLELTIV